MTPQNGWRPGDPIIQGKDLEMPESETGNRKEAANTVIAFIRSGAGVDEARKVLDRYVAKFTDGYLVNDRCELCGETYSDIDERGEFYKPDLVVLPGDLPEPSVHSHVQCALDIGMEVA